MFVAYQGDYDQIADEGNRLCQLAHPHAQNTLQLQLEQFKRKWTGLRGKISARSEALASNLLELTGLQDMLDEVWQWVNTAEETLGSAEASLIGDDLELVEKQLREHEVRCL